ncbi:acid phosphatase 1 [Tanacetum coccineum]
MKAKTTVMTTCHVIILNILTSLTTTISHRFIWTTPQDDHQSGINDDGYCERSWKFFVEANDAGTWIRVLEKCVKFIEEYMIRERYKSHFKVIRSYALAFAKSVEVWNDGNDLLVYDIDETLFSNLPLTYLKDEYDKSTIEILFICVEN